MAEIFTLQRKKRFQKLLLLAAESPYDGERQAALEAARRIASLCGMDLDEAARFCREEDNDAKRPKRRRSAFEEKREADDARWARNLHETFHATDPKSARESRRRQTERLDREARERTAAASNRRPIRSNSRIPPRDFARTLIIETRFSLKEIASITGVDERELIEMKLKLRGFKKRATG